MFNLLVLDVVMGLAFVYLLLALLCSTILEGIAAKREHRGRVLREAIQGMLDGAGSSREWTEKFYRHPLIRSLSRGGKLPSYIPADVFSKVVRDLLPGKTPEGAPRIALAAAARELPAGPLKETMRSLAPGPEVADDQAQELLESWFNSTMDRATGWYKRDAQWKTLVLAIVVTLLLNADTLGIIGTLWTNPTLRAAVVEQAKARAQGPRPLELDYTNADEPEESTLIRTGATGDGNALTEQEHARLGQLMGWSEDARRYYKELAIQQAGAKGRLCLEERERRKTSPCGPAATGTDAQKKADPTQECECRVLLERIDRAAQNDAFPLPAGGTTEVYWAWIGSLLGKHLLGWFVTVVAVTLGAPFWYDVLKKLVNIRSAGQTPETRKKKEKKSETPSSGTPGGSR